LINRVPINTYQRKKSATTYLNFTLDLRKNQTRHNSRSFALIRRDVRAINRSDVEKIVVSSKKGYKIANKEEAIEFINKRFRRDLSSLKTNWNLKRKVGLNNQIKMEKEMLKVVRTYVERVGENEQCQMD